MKPLKRQDFSDYTNVIFIEETKVKKEITSQNDIFNHFKGQQNFEKFILLYILQVIKNTDEKNFEIFFLETGTDVDDFNQKNKKLINSYVFPYNVNITQRLVMKEIKDNSKDFISDNLETISKMFKIESNSKKKIGNVKEEYVYDNLTIKKISKAEKQKRNIQEVKEFKKETEKKPVKETPTKKELAPWLKNVLQEAKKISNEMKTNDKKETQKIVKKVVEKVIPKAIEKVEKKQGITKIFTSKGKKYKCKCDEI